MDFTVLLRPVIETFLRSDEFRALLAEALDTFIEQNIDELITLAFDKVSGNG